MGCQRRYGLGCRLVVGMLSVCSPTWDLFAPMLRTRGGNCCKLGLRSTCSASWGHGNPICSSDPAEIIPPNQFPRRPLPLLRHLRRLPPPPLFLPFLHSLPIPSRPPPPHPHRPIPQLPNFHLRSSTKPTPTITAKTLFSFSQVPLRPSLLSARRRINHLQRLPWIPLPPAELPLRRPIWYLFLVASVGYPFSFPVRCSIGFENFCTVLVHGGWRAYLLRFPVDYSSPFFTGFVAVVVVALLMVLLYLPSVLDSGSCGGCAGIHLGFQFLDSKREAGQGSGTIGGIFDAGFGCLSGVLGVCSWVLEMRMNEATRWKNWGLAVLLGVTTVFLMLLILHNAAANTALYLHCKAAHGEEIADSCDHFHLLVDDGNC